MKKSGYNLVQNIELHDYSIKNISKSAKYYQNHIVRYHNTKSIVTNTNLSPVAGLGRKSKGPDKHLRIKTLQFILIFFIVQTSIHWLATNI